VERVANCSPGSQVQLRRPHGVLRQEGQRGPEAGGRQRRRHLCGRSSAKQPGARRGNEGGRPDHAGETIKKKN